MQKEIAQLLLEKKAVKVETNPPFTWTSGIKSPIYCDNRVLISYPEAVAKIVAGFKQIITEQKLEFDALAGTATAGIPWCSFLAYELKKPMAYIRPKPKEHGATKQVEGVLEKGSHVLIIEDLISTGGSSLGSAQACQREYESKIVGLLAIYTHGLKKAEQVFTEAKIPWFTLTNFSTLVGELDIAETQKELVLEFSKDPPNWWEKFQKS